MPAEVPWPWMLFGLDPQKLRSLEKIALFLGLVLSFIAFLVSLKDIGQYAGIDFRNRVVGARVLLTGQDPYTFQWQSGMPEELLDPCHDDKVHRLTVPPPTLFLYAAIAPLPYKVQRLISCVLEWLALVLSVALLARTIGDDRRRAWFLLTAIYFFLLSGFWRMHVERGQVYAFHLLLLSAGAFACASGFNAGVGSGFGRHGNEWLGGALFGLAALMRPNYLLIAPAFMLLRQWRIGLGTAGTFLFGILATLPFVHPNAWPSYLEVGDQYYLTLWAPEQLPTRPPPPHDGPVEGVDFLRHLDDLTSTSFAVAYQSLEKAGWLPIVDLGLVCKAMIGILSAILLILIFHWRNGAVRPQAALAVIICIALATDFFLPQRWGYVDVMLLLPLGLLWPYLWEKTTTSKIVVALLFVGFVGGSGLLPHVSLYSATLARSWLVMGGLTALAVVKGRDSKNGCLYSKPQQK